MNVTAFRTLPALIAVALGCAACDAGSSSEGAGGAANTGGAGSGGTSGQPSVSEGTLTIATARRTPLRKGVLGLNYWLWSPTWGDNVAGTEAFAERLHPGLLRVGGHNNDSNDPDPFNEDELDQAVAYAKAIGAEPLLQVPVLADVDGAPPSAETAAAMVKYANITREHGVKYFSIGNEPDLYPDQEAGMSAYTASDYCATVSAFVPAMLAVDPSIQIVGPDLSWKYQTGSQDWLTPILSDCGDLFDIISVHRYAVAPEQANSAQALSDAARFRAVITDLKAKIARSPRGERPLAFTETNITYNGDPAMPMFDASPGTLIAGLWAADALGVALESDVWSFDFWSIREGWTLGLIDSEKKPRPAYHALGLFADHFGDSSVPVTSAPKDVHAYASRNAEDDATLAIVVNFTHSLQKLTVEVAELPSLVSARFELPPLSVSALELPDDGQASGFVYSSTEHASGSSPAPIAPVTGD
jgi:hypothetical protein